MKISARNFIRGKIINVQKGTTTAHVSIEITGCVLTASIMNESVEELGLEQGKEASAIIKSSDVMIAID